jgi:DNA-binding NarL/FixJ family response regulator
MPVNLTAMSKAVMPLPETGMIVGIVDSNPLLAEGLAALLRQDEGLVMRTEFLGPSADGVRETNFDVIILDPAENEETPAELVRRLGAISILGYSTAASEKLARSCVSAGFRGILPKTVTFETLKIALATVARGGIFIDSAFAAAITPDTGLEEPPLPVQEACLSARELFVLKSVAHGKSMKEIGKELDLSSKTIETYKARGSSKLNLSGRRQIMEFAIARGWVDSTRLPAG